jgi:hypothetical protein
MPDNDPIESSASDFGTPFRALLDHCENKGLKFRASPKKKRITLNLCRRHALYNCSLQITHDDSVFQIHLSYPVLAKDKRMRPAVTEFIARANFGMVIGNFEMDMSDGEVRYHVGHVIVDGHLDDDTIGHLVSTALFTADRYFPSFMQLLFGGNTPEDAVFLAELDMHSDHVEDNPPTAAALPASEKDGGAEKPAEAAKPSAKKSAARRKKQTEPATPEGSAAQSQQPPADHPKPATDNPSAASEEKDRP